MIHRYSQNVIIILLFGTAMLCATSALAKAPVYTSFFSNVAVSGYDAVAYFTKNRALRGNPQYATQYDGAEWHFSSIENLNKFKSDPEKYAPQYGGYCAWAVANNKTAKGDPQQWAIYNGKLYLNYNSNIRDQWLADKEALIVKADLYWPGLIN